MKNIVLNTIKKYKLIEYNEHIIVGVSGGADSISLLHLLKSIEKDFKLCLTVVHINHGIREDANKDEEFVKNFCKDLKLDLEIFKFNIKKEAKKLSLSEEEAGRIFRYKAFNETLEKYKGNKIAVAHNKNDNGETLLLNLFRGSGLRGLCGIPFKRNNIIRPLLECSREEIEKYCNENDLKYIIDYTNNLRIYKRNKIRLDLIPYLNENFNKNIISILSNTANSIKEEESFLDSIVNEYLDKITIKKSDNIFTIDINLLKTYNIVIVKRILRKICYHFNENLNNISTKHIDIIIKLLEKQSGKSLSLPNNIFLKKEHNTLLITNTKFSDLKYEYKISLEEKVYIKELNKYIYFTKKYIKSENFVKKVCTICFNCDNIKDRLILRNRIAGDKIFLSEISSYKKLKDIFIDLKIPQHKRNSIPVIINNNEVIAILGVKLSGMFKPNKNSNNLAYIYYWEE